MKRPSPRPDLSWFQHSFWRAAARTTEVILASRPFLRRLAPVAPILAAAALAYLLGRLVGSLVPITW